MALGGDETMGIFHKMVNTHKRNNKMNQVKNNGNQIRYQLVLSLGQR